MQSTPQIGDQIVVTNSKSGFHGFTGTVVEVRPDDVLTYYCEMNNFHGRIDNVVPFMASEIRVRPEKEDRNV